MSLPAELRKKIKLLEIKTRRLVNSVLSGAYHSAFKGQGMTFAEFREYVPGDDVRSISWPLMARLGRPYIKKFDEERELIIMLAVDISGSLDFGSTNLLKGEIVAHLAAILGFAAAKNNDHVGLVLFSDRIEHFVPPKKGRAHVQRILRDIYFHKPMGHKTQISIATDYLRNFLKKRATVFVLSDFIDQGYAMSLRTMTKKHETVAVVIDDPSEMNLPNLGLVEFHDPETGESILVDSANKQVREQHDLYVKKTIASREKELRTSGVDCVHVVSGEDFYKPLIRYFQFKGRHA